MSTGLASGQPRGYRARLAPRAGMPLKTATPIRRRAPICISSAASFIEPPTLVDAPLRPAGDYFRLTADAAAGRAISEVVGGRTGNYPRAIGQEGRSALCDLAR